MASKNYGTTVGAIGMANDASAADIAAFTAPSALSIADLIAALRASSGNDDETMRRRAMFEAEARQRLEEDENRKHPGISAFSYPEGDIAHPKPPLKCTMYWLGHDETVEQNTPAEVDLMNQAKPGTYQFHRPSGAIETLTIEGRYGLGGELQSLGFYFPCRDAVQRTDVPSKVALLREAFGIEEVSTDALVAELARMRAKLAAAGVSV